MRSIAMSLALLSTLYAVGVGCVQKQPTWHDRLARATPPAKAGEDVADTVDHKSLPTREVALGVLLRTTTFTDIAVWAEGVTSVQLKAFGVLLNQPDAPQVFRTLLGHGDPAGQMFALCGLYLVDRPHFNAVVGRFRSDRRKLLYVYGCVPTPTTVAQLVQRRGPPIHFPPGHEAPEDFYSEFGGNTRYIDIVGGGWPEIFRTAVARMDANGDIRESEPALDITSDGSLFGSDEADEPENQAAPDGLPGR